MKWIIWLDTDGARRYLNLSNLHCLCDILMVSVSPTGWYMGYVPAIRLPSNLPSVNKQCCRQRHQAHPLHDLQYYVYVRNLSGRFVTASLVNLDMWQWFLLKIISTSFVASISLSSGDILPSSSYLNFSVVYCTYMCTMLFAAKLVCVQFMYSTSLEGQAVQVVLNGNKKMKVKLMALNLR